MKTNATKIGRVLCLGALLGAPLGCDDSAEFRGAIPTTQQVTVPVPGASGKTSATQEAGVGVESYALVGQGSEFYAFTWAVSADINTRALVLLGLLHLIVEQYPTSRTADSRTWGPWTPGGLDPLTYRAVVKKTGARDYTYAIDARPRASTADADFLPLLDGNVTKAALGDKGKGKMTLHFDHLRKLRADACEVGTVVGTFDDTGPAASLDVRFQQFANNNPQNPLCKKDAPADAAYHYDRAADGAGNFVFSLTANIHRADQNKPGLETSTVRSRWAADGRGRSDVKITGAEVTADLQAAHLSDAFVSASQCWDGSFKTVYETSSPAQINLIATAGDEAKCAFSSAMLP